MTTAATRFLSYPLSENTPTYGLRSRVVLTKSSAIERGDAANNTSIQMTVHSGTHLDMPCHFHANGQTIESFAPEFFLFHRAQCIEVAPAGNVVFEEVVDALSTVDKGCDLLIVKTGSCRFRAEARYALENFGFDRRLSDVLRETLPQVRVFGFDTISVSSFTDRLAGREAHRCFLAPEHPILLLEDMDLREVGQDTVFQEVIVAPLAIAGSDGIPCSVLAKIRARTSH